MKRFIGAILFLTAVVGLILGFVLLMNFTAPNPTGRRYSSEVVNLSANSNEKGQQGERILEKDLNLPNNNVTKQCICALQFANTSTPPPNCTTCIHYMEVASESGLSRRPDFVTDKYFIESKNVNGTLYNGGWSDNEQIRDYVEAAKATNRELWLFMRTEPTAEPKLVELIETTGGGVVQYFRVSDSSPDPIDTLGVVLLVASTVILPFGFVFLFMPSLKFKPRWSTDKPAPKPAPKPSTPVGDADDFLNRARDNARKTIDKEDSRPE